MGEELVGAWVVLPIKKPHWHEMHMMVRTVSDEMILAADPNGYHYDDAETEKGRRYWHERIDDLRRIIDSMDTKEAWSDAIVMNIKGFRVLFCGGTTWGDDPGGAFTVLSDMLEWPELLQEGDFDV